MKHTLKFRLSRLILLLGMVIGLSACQQSETSQNQSMDNGQNEEAAYAPNPAGCACEVDWFPHKQTPPPAEGKGSPFDAKNTTNCIFQQWAWQKFLWLTEPGPNKLPLFFQETHLVNKYMKEVASQLDQTLVLSSIKQAGTHGILKTNPAFNPSQNTAVTVYYSIHINEKLTYAADGFRKQIAKGSLHESNDSTFPVGSLELKVAWVETSAIPADKVDKYFTTQAAVQEEDKTYSLKTMAFIGMHIVGRVLNHPEFIWATFEHDHLGPNFDWAKMTATSSTQDLLFAKGSTNTLEGITWDDSEKIPELADMAYALFELGVPRNEGNGFMQTSQPEPMNYDNIKELNQCVKRNLMRASDPDVWANYFYKGAVWLDMDGLTTAAQAKLIDSLGHKIDNAKPGAPLSGCPSNINLTMETYAQAFQPHISKVNVSNLVNCFTCHSSVNTTDSKAKSPLYLSHIFNNSLALSKGKSIDEIEAVELKHFLQQMADKE